jgi:hypothetical protein
LCLQIAQIYSNKRLSSQIKKLKENYAWSGTARKLHDKNIIWYL